MADQKPEIVLPDHLGIILDGNRRWAKEQNLPTLKGHYQGAEVLHDIGLLALKAGIKYLSAYLFSTDNWNRGKTEVTYLMKLIIKFLKKYMEEFDENDIRILHVGSREGLPKEVIKAIDEAVKRTENNHSGTLALCINYGGQQEVVDAAAKLLRQNVDPKRLSVREFEQALYEPEIPPVDLVIRTSGEYRTSGFMMWRAAYAEYFFVDKYWPDFTRQDLKFALLHYAKRQRRFGK